MKGVSRAICIVLCLYVAGCVQTSPTKVSYADYSIEDQERLSILNGLWSGAGNFTTITHGYTTCPTVEVPILFYVDNGNVENMFPHHICSFESIVTPDGMLQFSYRGAGRLESDYAGSTEISYEFTGRLSGDTGKGKFFFGSCPGKWRVDKQAISRQKAEEFVNLLEKQIELLR